MTRALPAWPFITASTQLAEQMSQWWCADCRAGMERGEVMLRGRIPGSAPVMIAPAVLGRRVSE
jgi:hypothetical protein